jgi:hypothetical protein
MSPEQASGTLADIGPGSDVYSLGAVLYHLLTGRPPFQADTSLDTLEQVLDAEPLPPRLLNRQVPRDLEAICLKCLEKDPRHRYPSARRLGQDLQRFVDDEPVDAASIHMLDRVARVLRPRRHEEHFQGWGLGLMVFGAVIFLSHVAIFLFERAQYGPLLTYWIPRTVMFAALLIVLRWFRPHSILPTNAAERLVWVVWVGYVLCLGAVNAVRAVFRHPVSESYASFAILAGMGFLIMGGHVWGGAYVVGLAFLMAAPFLAMNAPLAPLAFGALWAAALMTFGWHYCRNATGRTLTLPFTSQGRH